VRRQHISPAPWVRAALVGVALLFPVVTPAAVDMTGLWRLHIELANNPGYLLDLTSHFLQSGTSLSNDLGYMGSIDPDTGQFSLFAPSTQCGAVDTMYGYASADNLRFDATGVVWVVNTGPRPPTPCLIADIVITGTRCGNGLVDPGEACDDGNLDDGDCCSADCQQVVADGTPCEDGAFCDGTDTCAGGTCSAHTGNPCSAGNVCDHTCNESVHSCNATLGTACAGDGNACTLDRCDGNGACTHVPTPGEAGDCPACELCDATGACAPRPRTCTMSTNPKTRLNVTNRTPDGGDRLRWGWIGSIAPSDDFGHPTTTDDYALCIFDESGPNPSLVLRSHIPAGGSCDGRPCWQQRGAVPGPVTVTYKNRDATPEGIAGVTLKRSGDPSDPVARIRVSGNGSLLALPAAVTPLPVPLRVQLGNAAGRCWAATFTTPTLNDGRKFRASAP